MSLRWFSFFQTEIEIAVIDEKNLNYSYWLVAFCHNPLFLTKAPNPPNSLKRILFFEQLWNPSQGKTLHRSLQSNKLIKKKKIYVSAAFVS
jgi:hypothetical protein